MSHRALILVQRDKCRSDKLALAAKSGICQTLSQSRHLLVTASIKQLLTINTGLNTTHSGKWLAMSLTCENRKMHLNAN